MSAENGSYTLFPLALRGFVFNPNSSAKLAKAAKK
jgi:hypothetical protein